MSMVRSGGEGGVGGGEGREDGVRGVMGVEGGGEVVVFSLTFHRTGSLFIDFCMELLYFSFLCCGVCWFFIGVISNLYYFL